jgi:hypothetical protein
MTALHLAQDTNEFCVVGRGDNADYRSLAHPYWCSDESDLAILKLASRSPWTFDWSTGVSVGDVAWSIGIVSPTGGYVSAVEQEHDQSFVRVQSSLRLNYGDSGSPLISENGRLIAVNTTALAKRSWSSSVYAALAQRPPETILTGGIEANCMQMIPR